MSIPLSPEVALGLLALFTGYIFYANWSTLQGLSTGKSKIFFSAVILAEIAIIAGSRFVTPDFVQVFAGRSSSLYTLADLGVFFLIMFGVFRLGDIVKGRML